MALYEFCNESQFIDYPSFSSSIQIRNRMHSSGQTSEDYIKQVLGLPENLVVECMIAFGYPDDDKEPVPKEQMEYEKIH